MRICSILLFVGILNAAHPPQAGSVVSVVRSDPRTGRLVRSVVVTSRAVAARPVAANVVAARVVSPAAVPEVVPSAPPSPEPTPPTTLEDAVARVAARHEVPVDLLASVVKVESNYDPFAISPKGALGLMQLIPATARRFGVGNVFDSLENLEGGARYLRYLLDLYNGNYRLALAAYNAGEAAVARYGGVPPYRETQNYLILVNRQLDRVMGARRSQPAPPQPQPPAPADAPAGIQEIVETDGTVRYVSRQ